MIRRRLTHATITSTLALLTLAIPSPSRGDQPPPPATSQGPASTPAPGERDTRDAMRERLRASIRRQLANMELRRQRLEHAMRLIDDGRPLSELRDQFGDLAPIWDARPGPDAGPPGQDAESGRGPAQGLGQNQVHPIDQLDRPLPGGSPDAPGAGGPSGPGPRRPGGPGAGERDGDGPGTGGPRRNRPGRGGGMSGEGRERGPDAPQAPIEIGASELSFVEEFLASSAPLILERFKELEKRDPEEARRRFIAMFPRVRFLYEMREHDPALFELRLKDIRFAREALEAARRVAEADAAATAGGQARTSDREKHVAALKTALSEQYKARTEILKRDLARAREHSDKLSADIDKRPGAEAATVETFARSMVEREKVRMERRGHRPERDDPSMPGGPGGPGGPDAPGEPRDPPQRPD